MIHPVLKVCNRTNLGKRVNRYQRLIQLIRDLGFFVGSDEKFTYINAVEAQNIHKSLNAAMLAENKTYILNSHLYEMLVFNLNLISNKDTVLSLFCDPEGTQVSAMEFIHNKGFNSLDYCVDYYGKKPKYFKVSRHHA